MSVASVPTEIESAVLALTNARATGSICPSVRWSAIAVR